MPVYEYYCADCSLDFEKIRPFRLAGEPAECPNCARMVEKHLPSQFTPVTMRDGYPRGLPDSGKTLYQEEWNKTKKKEGIKEPYVDV